MTRSLFSRSGMQAHRPEVRALPGSGRDHASRRKIPPLGGRGPGNAGPASHLATSNPVIVLPLGRLRQALAKEITDRCSGTEQRPQGSKAGLQTAPLSVGGQGNSSCAPTPKARALKAKRSEFHGPASEGGRSPGTGFHLSSSMLTEHLSKGRRASSATTCFRPANGFPKPPLPHNSVSAADGSTQLACSSPRPSSPLLPLCGSLLAALPTPALQPLLDSQNAGPPSCLPLLALCSWCSS